jgi:hypothetical protein
MHCPVIPAFACGPDSVAQLLGTSEALPPLSTPVWGKRYLPFDGVCASFSQDKLPLAIIYILAPRSGADDAPRIEEISPREALLDLVQNTYRNWLLDRQQRAVEFDMLPRLVRHVSIRRIVPSPDPDRLNELCSLIVKNAESAVAEKSTSNHQPRP